MVFLNMGPQFKKVQNNINGKVFSKYNLVYCKISAKEYIKFCEEKSVFHPNRPFQTDSQMVDLIQRKGYHILHDL